ncbi:hypothetical protein LXL04_020146 [Taraxacum kok-saghyz]
MVRVQIALNYQSRKLETRYGQKKSNEQTKQYCHLLNSTLMPTERTLCCILNNYQKEDGVEVPEVLVIYRWPDHEYKTGCLKQTTYEMEIVKYEINHFV